MSSMHIRFLGEAPASIWELNASEVRDRTASLRPTPGGGSISVFTATLGLALAQKGASVSLKRVGENKDRREALEALCEEIGCALEAMSRLADDDSQAFQQYLKARSLPRSTEGEKKTRDEAMESAILGATRIPLASARSVYGALEYVESTLKLCEREVMSDVFGGAILMQAASKAVLLNVSANVLLLANAETRAELEAERAELERLCSARGESIAGVYEVRMADSKDFVG